MPKILEEVTVQDLINELEERTSRIKGFRVATQRDFGLGETHYVKFVVVHDDSGILLLITD